MTFPETEVRADVVGEADDATVIAESLARPERFAVIFDRYFAEVHRYAERRLGTEAADEIASDTFLAAFGKRDRYGAKSPDGVVFTIHPRAIPAGDRLAIAFPRRDGNVPKPVPASPVPYVPGATPSPVASSSGVPGATPSPVSPGRPAPHPVAIRLIPAIAPACTAPSAVPSAVPPAVPSPR